MFTGRKATMASTKVWEHGQLNLHNPGLAVDHGMATAMTRVGILGEQSKLFKNTFFYLSLRHLWK